MDTSLQMLKALHKIYDVCAFTPDNVMAVRTMDMYKEPRLVDLDKEYEENDRMTKELSSPLRSLKPYKDMYITKIGTFVYKEAIGEIVDVGFPMKHIILALDGIGKIIGRDKARRVQVYTSNRNGSALAMYVDYTFEVLVAPYI